MSDLVHHPTFRFNSFLILTYIVGRDRVGDKPVEVVMVRRMIRWKLR